MKVVKVLNNNVLVSHNEKGQEIIIMGRGIAFQKNYGDLIDEKKIEKIFVLTEDEFSDKLKQFILDIPMEFFLTTEKIINFAIVTYGKKLSERVYIALTDHIYSAVERYKQGIEFKNGLLWETKRLYKEEYEVGKQALTYIKEDTGIMLSEDEAAFIALHIVNAQINTEMSVVMNIAKLTQEILNIIKYYFNTEFDEESLNFHRFLTHLKYFAQRLFSKTYYEDETDGELFKMVKTKLKREYMCTEKIATYIEENYEYTLHNEEKLYLMIHISHVIS